MAKNKLAPDEGPHGVDRWSCNGYGLTINGKKVEPPANDDDKDVEEVEEAD